MSNRKLSKYVTEQMYTFSETAVLKHLDNTLKLDAQFVLASKCAQRIIDPIGNYYPDKKLIMSSGFRGKQLNKAVKGDEHSDHCINLVLGGVAWDINFKGINPKKLFNDIYSGRIKQPNGKQLRDIIDQCIYEERHTKQGVSRWVHLGIRNLPRKQFMYTLDAKTYHTATHEIT